jgi:hypothetical protein
MMTRANSRLHPSFCRKQSAFFERRIRPVPWQRVRAGLCGAGWLADRAGHVDDLEGSAEGVNAVALGAAI